MVGCGRASRISQFRKCGLRRCVNIVGLQACPNWIERFEPVEEIGILRGGDGAGEGLVEVVVGVDQAGQDDVPAQVENFIGSFGKLVSGTDLFDETVPNKKTTRRDFTLVGIHCD